jgi:hypothetical protein
MSFSYNDIIREHWQRMRGGDTDPTAENKLIPLYTIDYKDEQTLSDWLVSALAVLQTEQEPRARTQLTNINFFNGIQALGNQSGARFEDRDNNSVSLENRWVMNHIRDFTHQKQSRWLKYSPTLNVFPWNNEYADRLGARLGKRIIDSTFYTQDIKALTTEIVLETIVCGESYLFVEWDPTLGDKTPGIDIARDLKASNVTSFTNKDGEEIDLDIISRIGDHKLNHPLPFMVLHEPQVRWVDVNYVFKGTIKHKDQVRAENRGVQLNDFGVSSPDKNVSEAFGMSAEIGDWVIEWEFYHKGIPLLDKGFYCKFVGSKILKKGPLPYSHRGLPCVRLTDYDDLLNAHGRSFYEDLKLPSVMINNMMKIAYRSFAIAAYPKLIMPENSCNMYSMANGPFVVEYKPGMNPPEIVSFNAVNKDFFPLSEHVENFMQKSSGTFGISRGDTVPNARARSILNFYEEQEEQRESFQIQKYSSFIEKLGKMILGNSGDFFKPEDGRTLRIVGKNNQFKIRKVQDVSKLSSPYDVKCERTTAMSESKQGRIDQISTLSTVPLSDNDGTPGLFTREQILNLIEVADTPTFFEMATAAAERAASENEDMFEGIEVSPPAEFQAHLVDWNSHFQFMQSREFVDTDGIPPEVRTKFLEHFIAHEGLMYDHSKVSMKFCEVLMANPYFPAVLKIDIPVAQLLMMHQQGMLSTMPMLPPGGVPGEPGQAPQMGDSSTAPTADTPPEPDTAPQADAPPMETPPVEGVPDNQMQ